MGRKRKRTDVSTHEEVKIKCNHNSRDALTLLHVFPEEIWLLIFEVLSNVKGCLQNVSNASPYFRNILLEKRVYFLFPNVWEILAQQYEAKHQTDNSFNEPVNHDRKKKPSKRTRITCTDCGSTRFKKYFSGILNLRFVCKSWSNAFDNFLQEPRPNRKYIGLEDIGHQEFRQHTMSKIFHFLQHFGNIYTNSDTNRSPFVSRSIYLQFDQDCENTFQYLERFLLEIQSILRQYGKHIWYCELSTGYSDSSLSDFYIILKRILQLMPNLKMLTINHRSINYNLHPDMQNVLNERINREPMEPFNQLTYLTVNQLHFPIFNELVRRSRNIAKLQGNLDETCDIYNVSLSNLKDASLPYASRSCFERLSESHWLLEKLELNFEKNLYIEWSQLFTLIEEKWGNSLTDLTLGLPKPTTMWDKSKIAREANSFRLELKSLKRLKLILHNFTTVDFILPLKHTLEYLDVTILWRGGQDYRQGSESKIILEQKIQFLSYIERPLESNIWSIFPNLKSFELRNQYGLMKHSKRINWSHTRKDWKRFNSGK